MSNDVADIQATLKNIGVTATPEQIQNKLNAFVKFYVTAKEAKRNIGRSLAKGAGVDPVAIITSFIILKLLQRYQCGLLKYMIRG